MTDTIPQTAQAQRAHQTGSILLERDPHQELQHTHHGGSTPPPAAPTEPGPGGRPERPGDRLTTLLIGLALVLLGLAIAGTGISAITKALHKDH